MWGRAKVTITQRDFSLYTNNICGKITGMHYLLCTAQLAYSTHASNIK